MTLTILIEKRNRERVKDGATSVDLKTADLLHSSVGFVFCCMFIPEIVIFVTLEN